MNRLLYIILGIIVVVILWLISIYNSLVRLNNKTKEAWSDIDVQLKRRHDLIPNLVETVKGYAKHEEGVFTKVTEARANAISAKNPAEIAQAENALTGALKTLFAVAENYPQLKANENFMQLQGRISGLENELADRREFYNDSANQFNIRIESFPDVMVARMMNCKEQEMFKVSEEDKKDVKVEF